MAPNAKRSCSRWMSHGFHTEVSSMACNAYNELTLMGKQCDAIIRVQSTDFHVHKTVLDLCSPYFRALFKNDLGSADRNVYNIPGVHPQTMWSIIEYAYTNSAEITPENAMDLFIAADQFNIMGIINLCSKFIACQIDLENFLDIWRVTNHYLCPDLRQKTLTFILHHFQELVKTSDKFFELTLQELRELIEKDELNVTEESAVFEAIVRWINFAPAERKESMRILLPQIRLALINKEYVLNNIMANVYVKDNEDCKAIVNTALTLKPNMVRPRLPYAIVFALCGYTGSELANNIRPYDTRANRWTRATSAVRTPTAHHGTAYLNGYIYLIGGFDGSDYLRNVQCFDPMKKTWHEAASMNYKRGHVCVTVLDNYIYAMGGFDGQQTLHTVERYDPEANRWTLISSMQEKRKDAGATTLNGKIYICGGSNGQDYLSSAEVYNPESRQWSYISPMKSRRSGSGVTAYRGKVFAISGYDGHNCLWTVETYSPLTKTWCRAPNILKRRRNFGTAVIDDRLYVVGGRNNFIPIFTNEFYDEKTKAWRAQTNEISPSVQSCCVVPGLQNIKEYIS
ncbi:kelch-like protein 10 [Leptodactylus fuscus]|uniref:kelch-like protein 10 n=1 Tax=Leptodactylus fuscus TaxID=238119 RepID=UPI003F4F285D